MPVIGDPHRVRDIDGVEASAEQAGGWNGRTAIRGAVAGGWHGEQVHAVLALVAALPEAKQMRCFVPRYAIRLRNGPTVLAEIAFCFRCRNGRAISFQPDFVVPSWFTFDPDSQPARRLLGLFRAAGTRTPRSTRSRPIRRPTVVSITSRHSRRARTESVGVSTKLRDLARDTLQVLDAGSYRTPSGGSVDLADGIRAAVAGTRLYQPTQPLATPPSTGKVPTVSVTGESTLAASRRLAHDGDVAALVFASAKNPGGGFRTGAQAHEESIARASALYCCLTAVPQFYAFHRSRSDSLYSDRVIHSPGVPVFRDDDGRLLETPYDVSFLTAAAPNRGAVPAGRAGQVAAVLAVRARRVLAVAAAHGHRRLVLGAWGCGVFRNDPATVAGVFADALVDSAGWFNQVVFAVLDHTKGTPVRAAFAARFPPAD